MALDLFRLQQTLKLVLSWSHERSFCRQTFLYMLLYSENCRMWLHRLFLYPSSVCGDQKRKIAINEFLYCVYGPTKPTLQNQPRKLQFCSFYPLELQHCQSVFLTQRLTLSCRRAFLFPYFLEYYSLYCACNLLKLTELITRITCLCI